jgi:hypothetical protein
MAIAGLVVTMLGFIISLLSLIMAESAGARLAIVLAGLVVSLIGIIGILNPAYIKHAIWRQ